MPSNLLLRGVVKEGNVLLIPAGQPHTAQFITDAEYLAIFVEHDLVARAARDSEVESAEFDVRHVHSDPVVSHIAMALDSEMNSGGIGGQMYVESLANLLAVHMLRHYTVLRPALKPVRGGLGGFRLRKATEFINDNLEHELSLADIATEVGMSPFHFTREFKKATGYAPHQYLINGRISRAKGLLTSSDLPIVEIGFRSGFKNQGHFSRLFRRLTAMTPKTYREHVRQ
jgi:AraC family transcriptional regulator